MSGTARSSRHQATLKPAHLPILRALSRYRFLIAQQVCRLLYSKGSLTRVQQLLRELEQQGFCQRQVLPKATPYGRGPWVYSLARAGLNQLQSLGIEVGWRFRPSEQARHSYLFLTHTLALNDILIGLELLTRRFPVLRLHALRHERDLQQTPIPVQLANGERTTVIPDGWVDLRIAEREQFCAVLEVDMGTEEQKRWRKKVAALLAYADGPYLEQFGTASLTIAVIAVGTIERPDARPRRDDLLRWTEAELTALNARDQADLFWLTDVPVTPPDPAELFFAPRWFVPFDHRAHAFFEDVPTLSPASTPISDQPAPLKDDSMAIH